MRRLSWLVILTVALSVAPAAAAGAATVAVGSATPGAGSVSVQVSGQADVCDPSAYCDSQNLVVEAEPSSGYAFSSGCSTGPVSPQFTQALPAGGGAFSASPSIQVEAGQAVVVCAFVQQVSFGYASTVAYSQPVTVTLAPQPCPAGSVRALTLQAPRSGAYGREVTVTVDTNPSALVSYSPATVTMLQQGVAQPLYTGTLSQSDLSGAPVGLYVVLGDGGAAVIELAWTQDVSDTDQAQCSQALSTTIDAVPGTLPQLQWDGLMASLSFTTPGDCNTTRVAAESVQVSWHRAHEQIATRDLCAAPWHRRGRIPGVSVSTDQTDVSFNDTGNLNTEYRVAVRIAGRLVRTLWLSTYYSHENRYRVWDGTDAFINYCIDQNQTVYSYHLHLFCWHPGYTIRVATLSGRP